MGPPVATDVSDESHSCLRLAVPILPSVYPEVNEGRCSLFNLKGWSFDTISLLLPLYVGLL